MSQGAVRHKAVVSLVHRWPRYSGSSMCSGRRTASRPLACTLQGEVRRLVHGIMLDPWLGGGLQSTVHASLESLLPSVCYRCLLATRHPSALQQSHCNALCSHLHAHLCIYCTKLCTILPWSQP